MRKLYLLSIFIVTALVTINCKKKNDPPPADTPSVFQITKPSAGAIYLNGTNLEMQGSIEDVNGLASVKVEVIKTATSEVLYQQNLSAGGVTYYNLNRSWTISGITSATNAKVKITATDLYSYQAVKEINIVLSD